MTIENRLVDSLNRAAASARTSADALPRILERADQPRRRPLVLLTIAAMGAATIGVASLVTSDNQREQQVATGQAPGTTAAAVAQPVLPGAAVLELASKIRVDGIGPVRIGMTLEEVTRVAGVPLRAGNRASCRTLSTDAVIPGLVFVSLQGDRLDYIEVASKGLLTEAGVGVGSSVQEVENASPAEVHGRVAMINGVKASSSTILVLRSPDSAFSDRALAFYATDGVVSRVKAGAVGAVTDAASCE